MWQANRSIVRMNVCAKNLFNGTVVSVASNSIINKVDLVIERGYLLTSIGTNADCGRLNISPGDSVTATINPCDVSIQIVERSNIDSPNRFFGKILSVYTGGVMGEVFAYLFNGIYINTIIYEEEIQALELNSGSVVFFYLNPCSVALTIDKYSATIHE
jgi:molybdopterin-binding protein